LAKRLSRRARERFRFGTGIVSSSYNIASREV
jgi:hypothetical protein